MPAAARLGDKAQVDADAHGCPACPHPGVGPIVTGSPDVLINSKPAARLDDLGIHAVCCGPNTFTVKAGSPTVYVNGKPLARMNDQTKHCGGSGPIIEGSPDVLIDDGASAQGLGSYASNALQILSQTPAPARRPQPRRRSDTHTATVATQQPPQECVTSGRWAIQRAKPDQDVELWIRCTPNLTGALSIEIWFLDADGTPNSNVQTLQANAAPSVKTKWKAQLPPNAGDRRVCHFHFVVTDAHGGKVTSDPLFVERPALSFSFSA
jgi:uncharacterized Zn-binding protein involved in type VI secretion